MPELDPALLCIFKLMIMRSTNTAIIILLVLDIAVLLAARWFDQRYYLPFLNATMSKARKEPVYKANLFNIGLLTAGSGLLIWTLIFR